MLFASLAREVLARSALGSEHMSERRSRTRALSTRNAVFVGLLASMAVHDAAWSKGGLVSSGTQVAPVEQMAPVSGGLKLVGQTLKTLGACPTDDITKSQCMSASFAKTTCGVFEASRIRNGQASSCAQSCPAPTPSKCQSQTFWTSLCGVVEEQKSAVPLPAACFDEDPDTVCPSHPSSLCVNKLRTTLENVGDASGTMIPGAPLVSSVVPSSTPPLGDSPDETTAIVANGFANPDVRRTVRHLEPSFNAFRSQGTSVHYWGHMLDDHSMFLPTNAPSSVLARRSTWQGNRAEWNANDSPPNYRMDSCAEYVYEKYYDYSRFEDATRAAGADYRQFVDVAFGNQSTPSSIGTRALAGIGLRAKNGDSLPVALQFDPTARPKNPFFLPSGSFAKGAARQEAINTWESQGRTIALSYNGEERVIETSRPLQIIRIGGGGNGFISSGVALGFVLVDESVLPVGALQLTTILSTHPTKSEGFAYHQQKAAAFPASRDEELSAYDRMGRSFEGLWHERMALSQYITAMLTITAEVPTLVNEVPFDPSIFEYENQFTDIWDSQMNPIDDIIRTHREFENDRSLMFGLDTNVSHILGGQGVTQKLEGVSIAANLGGGAGKFPGVQGDVAQYSQEFLAGLNLNQGGLDEEEFALDLSREDTVRFVDELERAILDLVALDDRIQKELARARSIGCLSTSNTNPCDWAPRHFAEAISGQLMSVREKDYQSCLAATADDFQEEDIHINVDDRFKIDLPGAANDPLACLDTAPYPCAGDFFCDDPAYNTSHTRLENFPKCRDAYHAMYLRLLDNLLNGAGGIIDPATGEVAPYEGVSDSERLGDDLFAVSYAYGAEWRLGGIPPEGSENDSDRWCGLEPTLSGHFDVEATVLGADFSLVAAGFDMGLGAGAVQRASLEIVGQSLIDVGPTSAPLNPATWNLVFEEGEGRFDEYFSASATFMVGPVPVKIAGGVGGVIAVSAIGQAGSPPGGGGCAAGDLGVEARFVPIYGVSAFASASVDAVVVEVGVKISIDVVTVSFPIQAGVRFEGLPNNDTRINVTNDVDLVFSILGGRVSAFVEVCVIFCEEFDVTLWRWAPTRFSANLFHSAIDFRLGPLVEAQSEIAAMAN